MRARRVRFWLAALLSLALLLGACSPQGAPVAPGETNIPAPAGETTGAPAETQPAVPGVTEAAGAGETAAPTEAGEVLAQSSNLIGLDLMDADGASLGQIVDVLVDQTGHIQSLVVDVPAAADGEARQVVVDWEQVETVVQDLENQDVQLQFQGVAQDLETALEFDVADLDDTVVIRTEGTSLAQELNNLIRLSQLQNLDLQPQGELEPGQLEDLLVDVQQGQVDFAVVDLSQLLGTELTVVVPWERFNIDPNAAADAQAFQLDVTAETLQNAPPIDLSQLPMFVDPQQIDWNAIMQFWNSVG